MIVGTIAAYRKKLEHAKQRDKLNEGCSNLPGAAVQSIEHLRTASAVPRGRRPLQFQSWNRVYGSMRTVLGV